MFDHGKETEDAVMAMRRTDEIKMIEQAVNWFATRMTARMVEKLDAGFSGWDSEYPAGRLYSEITHDAVGMALNADRGIDNEDSKRAVDIANRAMMLFVRGESPEALAAFRKDHPND